MFDDDADDGKVDQTMYQVLDTTDAVLVAGRRNDFECVRHLVKSVEGLARVLLLQHWVWLLTFAPPWTHAAGRRSDLPTEMAEPISRLVGSAMQDRDEKSVIDILIEIATWPADDQDVLAMEIVGELVAGLPATVTPRRYVIARERLARAEATLTGESTSAIFDETPLVATLTRLVTAFWFDTQLPAKQVTGGVLRALVRGFPGNPPDLRLQRTAVAVLARTIAATRAPGETMLWCDPAGGRPVSAKDEIIPGMGHGIRATVVAARVVDHAVNGQSHRIIPELEAHADDPAVLALALAATAHRASTTFSDFSY